MSDLQDYRELIDRLASVSMNRRIPNAVPENAVVVIAAMFRYARREARIFAGNLSAHVYGSPELVEEVRRFLGNPGSRLRVLLQQSMTSDWVEDHPLLKCLRYNRSSVRGTIDVRCATGAYASGAAKHFSVVDDRAYRFEFDHGTTQAVANFNEPDVARKLIVAFDRAIALASSPIFTIPVPSLELASPASPRDLVETA